MQTKMDSRDWDSVLGEQCGSIANFTKETSPTASGVSCFVKGTTDKVANLPQSLQSSHSPTATPRILEKESQTESENKNSSFFTHNTPIFNDSQAEAVEMRNCGFQDAGEGIYLSGNEQVRAAESAIYRSNATPKPKE